MPGLPRTAEISPARMQIEDIGGGLSLQEEVLLGFDVNELASRRLRREVFLDGKMLHPMSFE